jgi:hypothetical protein
LREESVRQVQRSSFGCQSWIEILGAPLRVAKSGQHCRVNVGSTSRSITAHDASDTEARPIARLSTCRTVLAARRQMSGGRIASGIGWRRSLRSWWPLRHRSASCRRRRRKSDGKVSGRGPGLWPRVGVLLDSEIAVCSCVVIAARIPGRSTIDIFCAWSARCG